MSLESFLGSRQEYRESLAKRGIQIPSSIERDLMIGERGLLRKKLKELNPNNEPNRDLFKEATALIEKDAPALRGCSFVHGGYYYDSTALIGGCGLRAVIETDFEREGKKVRYCVFCDEDYIEINDRKLYYK